MKMKALGEYDYAHSQSPREIDCEHDPANRNEGQVTEVARGGLRKPTYISIH